VSGVSVTLRSVWLTDASDLSDSVQVKVTSLADTPDSGGAIRRYAGGRTRWVTTPGVVRKITLTAQLVDAVTLAWLEAHKDALVLLRDPTGRKRYCTYATFEADPYTFANFHDLSGWDLYETSHSEAV
jgi:hypothetical protein